MNAIPNSKPEKAIIKAKGNSPKKKNTIPEIIILYVNPPKILSSMWPDKLLTPSFNDKKTIIAKYGRSYFNLGQQDEFIPYQRHSV